jgi:hypothetical protein
MSKRAELAVLALTAIVRVLRAKFRFILIRTVELFDFIVALTAFFTEGTCTTE